MPDTYIKFDGVDGESQDAQHDKWIDVLSTDWGRTQAGTTSLPQVVPTNLGLPKP